MGKIRIGIIDTERSYVEKLSAYLNRFGKEVWIVSGFTDYEVLEKSMKDGRVDILMNTDFVSIKRYKQMYPDIGYIWLTENKTDGKGLHLKAEEVYSIYRYQSAEAIGQAVKDIVIYLGILKNTEKKTAVIYSPVGRCGKTTLAMDFVENGNNGKWLYIGMEDYSYLVSEDKYDAEDFLYYVKERHEEAVLNILGNVSGIIPSPFSPFDTRQIGREDVEWFLNVFEKCSSFKGVIFDVGTGILKDLNVLLQFDHVVVPYLNNNKSMEKRQQLEELIKAYELEELLEKIYYLEMDKGDPKSELKMLLN